MQLQDHLVGCIVLYYLSTAEVISWRSVTHMCFLAFSHQYKQLFFPKPPTTFLTCFCRGERRKYVGKKSRLNQGSNSQPPGLESDTLTTEPPGRGRLQDQTARSVPSELGSTLSGIALRFALGSLRVNPSLKVLNL